MKYDFDLYKPRKIEFQGCYEIGDWQVKITTISHKDHFQSPAFLQKALHHLPQWLQKARQVKLPHHNIAFLVLHEGQSGIWYILNWWLDGEIKRTITYLSKYETPDMVEMLPEEGSMACVWELEVIDHESRAWTDHILKQANKPDFQAYLSDGLSN